MVVRTSSRHAPLLALALLVLPALAGCLDWSPPERVNAPRIAHHSFTAVDYGYQGVYQVSAGMARFTLTNRGHDLHHLQLVRLDGDHTLQELLSALRENPEVAPPWAHFVGGPNAVSRNLSASAVVTLHEGRYAILCLIPDRAGVPHYQKGMARVLEVKPNGADLPSSPPTSGSITLTDFNFTLDKAPAAGTRTFHTRNQGLQPHEVTVARLQGNATVHDLVAAFAPNATARPPADFIGGITLLDPGTEGYFTVQFTPGRYALLCFVFDPGSKRLHHDLGMAQEIAVT